jgi:hypothetical protein
VDLLFSACHEAAHQRGFILEAEAQALGYLACRDAVDADLRYAAALHALNWVLEELWRTQLERWRHVWHGAPRGFEADWDAWIATFGAHEPLAEAQVAHDALLKAQGQSEGLAAYEGGLEIVIGYERRYPLG